MTTATLEAALEEIDTITADEWPKMTYNTAGEIAKEENRPVRFTTPATGLYKNQQFTAMPDGRFLPFLLTPERPGTARLRSLAAWPEAASRGQELAYLPGREEVAAMASALLQAWDRLAEVDRG